MRPLIAYTIVLAFLLGLGLGGLIADTDHKPYQSTLKAQRDSAYAMLDSSLAMLRVSHERERVWFAMCDSAWDSYEQAMDIARAQKREIASLRKRYSASLSREATLLLRLMAPDTLHAPPPGMVTF